MKFVSIALHVHSDFYAHFWRSDRKRTLSRICKELSRSFPALGVYHSHNTEKKGGEFSPHIHLIIHVPTDRLSQFLDGLEADLRTKDKQGYFILSPRKQWVVKDDALDLTIYTLGEGRRNMPIIVHAKKNYFGQYSPQ